MAINLQNYLDRISSLGIIQLPKQSDVSQNLNTETTISEKDAYIPSMSNAADIMPSTNYNTNGMQVGEMPMNSQAQGVSQISSTETPAVEENQAASTESGGANSSNSEDETTEKIVVINGITYLETTKVENGVEITTRQEL